MKRRMGAFLVGIFIIFAGCPEIFGSEGYVIGDEDVLLVSVWGSPELTIQVPVRPDGMITVPPVGDVKAAGLTPQELKVLLEKELAKFVKAPTVSVVVTAINSFKVFVLGGGVSSGTAAGTTLGAITLRRNTTLLQFMAQLGGLMNADLKKSFILRNGEKLSTDFYRLAVKGDVSQDIQLKPNDILFIPDNYDNRIMVLGQVRTPSVVTFREGMTVLDAVLGAGGFAEFADQNDVTVVRKEGERVKKINVKLKSAIQKGEIDQDLSLKPGDRIFVD